MGTTDGLVHFDGQLLPLLHREDIPASVQVNRGHKSESRTRYSYQASNRPGALSSKATCHSERDCKLRCSHVNRRTRRLGIFLGDGEHFVLSSQEVRSNWFQKVRFDPPKFWGT
jgi:hypothetical protein